MEKKKEKMAKEIRVVMQPSLFVELEKKSRDNYENISETIRRLIREWIKKDIKMPYLKKLMIKLL